MEILIPHPEKKRALILVDIQEGFLNDENRSIIPALQKVIREGAYDLIIEVVFHADPGSLWDRQTGWTFPSAPTTPAIKNLIPEGSVLVHKSTKSAFKGDMDLAIILNERGIEEVHVVGLDTNDCVFATAQESFDLGFYTYVLEECTASSERQEDHAAAIQILRHLSMTNHGEIRGATKILSDN